MVFDKTKPENDMLLINFPAACRINWIALETMTEASLLIKNAKCAADMGLVDTKLAQIVTASKVHGTAITGLASVPAGAGALPSANSPNKLAADSLDSTPQYLDSLIDTDDFDISAGDLLQLKPAKDPFQVGDLIPSTVTTARTGWTNVSVTYANKFMRISATPLTTGGVDSHVHTGPSHTHPGAAHTHTLPFGKWASDPDTLYANEANLTGPTWAATDGYTATHWDGSGATATRFVSDSTTPSTSGCASGTGNTGSGSNVPIFVQVTIFQKS